MKLGDMYYDFTTRIVQHLFRAYATIFFCNSTWVGAWFALISWAAPRTAFTGLFSLLCTWLWGRLLAIKPPGDLHLLNGLLCGLFISAYYPLTPQLLLGLIIVTLFITICVNWFCSFMWNLGKVPLMSLPFVLGTWALILIFHEKQLTTIPALQFTQANLPDFLSWPCVNDFFSSIGGLMLVPYPLTGALIFLGLVIVSRYLALLAIAGYMVGAFVLYFLDYSFLIVPTGYNFSLTAIALGGIFIIPSRFSFFIALCGSALAALFVLSLHKLLYSMQLPILVLPFLLSTYFWLGGLSHRIDKKRGILNLDAPITPEIAWDRYRLESARGIHLESASITQPFLEEWHVAEDDESQRLYFFRNKYAKDSTSVEEQLVFAPANASVIEMRDTSVGEYSTAPIDGVWGNYLLLRDYFGRYILLPHLKAGSIKPRPGEWLMVGQPIASCELFNDSEYRLYMQIQIGVRPKSKSLPFHFYNIISNTENQPKEFNLFYYPKIGDTIRTAQRDEAFAMAVNLMPGLSLTYSVSSDKNLNELMMLQTGITPQGQTRLYAAKDISAGYEQTSLSLAFYDMQGRKDILLDLWVLAMGLTPLTNQVDFWHDKPALNLWPLSTEKKLLLGLVRPLGVGCDSEYTRTWDEKSQTWIQNAIHRADIMPGTVWIATTSAIIDPKRGVTNIRLEAFGKTWQAVLLNDSSKDNDTHKTS